jgi:alanyl-tRNA synthetase
MALFGEKYGEVVRVVMIDPAFSIELCGGTHVGATGELGFFKIKSETGIAAGIRRLEAVAGPAAENHIETELAILQSLREQLKNPKDPLKTLQELFAENHGLRKQIESLELRQAGQIKETLLQGLQHIGPYVFIGQICEGLAPDAIRKLAGELRQEMPDLFLVLGTVSDGKPSVVVSLGERLVAEKSLDASKIIKEIVAPLIKGGGGGQKNLATAGGRDAGGLEAVIRAAKALL